MYVEDILKIEVPAPFTKEQKKEIGLCTIAEIEEARRVLEATEQDDQLAKFLLKLKAEASPITGPRRFVIEMPYEKLRHLADFREKQLNAPKVTKAKAKKKGSK